MGADADHDEKFRLLDALCIGLRIRELGNRRGRSLFDFLFGAVADEDRLAAPFDGHARPFGQCREIDFRGGESECGGVRAHLADERPGYRAGANGAHCGCGNIEKIPAGRFDRRCFCHDNPQILS